MKNGIPMKSVWVLLLAVALLCATMAVCYAESLDEWNRSCRNKTIRATPVYAMNDALCQGEVVTHIPANTYVKVSSGMNGTIGIRYRTIDGREGSGWTHQSNLKFALVYFKNEHGLNDSMQELLFKDKYGYIPADGNAGNLNTSANGNASNPSTSKPSSPSSSKKTSSAAKETVVVRHGDEAVQLVRLGVASSTVIVNGEEKEVPTSELDFGSTAEKEKQVAVIHAPKTGKCTLRAKASDSGKALQKCKAGTVVMVLEYGRNFCKISDDGNVGYVQTGCLKGYDAETEGMGLLSYNGKTTGSTTINVRNAPSGDSAKVAEWKTGTEVEVFGLEKGWYEIEYMGIHGFVMEKFLIVEE